MIKHRIKTIYLLFLLTSLICPVKEAQSIVVPNSIAERQDSLNDYAPFIRENVGWSSSTSDRFSFGSLIALASPTPKQISVPQKCGQQFRSVGGRIVGGQIATISQFPWMISLQREKGNWYGMKAFYHSCGGSLITSSWIVTAAHCLYNRDEPLRAVAGTDNLNFMYRAQIREISQQIVHPQFDIGTYDNDIALLKVNKPFELDSTFSHVGTVCLSPNMPILPYDIATICGFGSRAFRAKTRHHLYETQIAIIDKRTCNRSFEGYITKNMICAGGMIANKRDACSGDSGGPLTLDNENGQAVLVGVVSFGQDCARAHFPGVYTNIEAFYNWIMSHIDEPLTNS